MGILFNQLQFHSIMFYSILELGNTIAPVYLRTSTEILDPGLSYYRGGGGGGLHNQTSGGNSS